MSQFINNISSNVPQRKSNHSSHRRESFLLAPLGGREKNPPPFPLLEKISLCTSHPPDHRPIEQQHIPVAMAMVTRFVLALVLMLVISTVDAFLPRSMGFRPRTMESLTKTFLSTSDFKTGLTLEIDGVPVRLLEFLHVKPGKGSAFVRSKIKNLVNGSVQERTFRAGETVASADVTKGEMQYTFTEGDNFCFMNMETFEEQRIPKGKLDNPLLMKPGLTCQVSIWNEQVIDVQLPPSVQYTVIECPPNFKGNSAQGSTKPATIEGGAVVNVPMFIEQGEDIIISTEDVKYLGKAAK